MLLLAAGLAWGLVPGLTDAAAGAAARLVDRPAVVDAVLRGGARRWRHPGTASR